MGRTHTPPKYQNEPLFGCTATATGTERIGKSDTDDVETNPTLHGRERTNQRRTQLAAQTGHEDRSHEMRRQKKRETKRISRAKKNELSPPPLRKNKDKDVGPNQEIPRRATEFHQMRPAESSKSLRLLALRPRTNSRRLWNLHQHETNLSNTFG